ANMSNAAHPRKGRVGVWALFLGTPWGGDALGAGPDLGTESALFPAEALSHDGGRAAGHRGLRRLATRHRLLLGVMLDEVAGRAPELEHRHLALAAIAEAKRDDRRADARAHVDGADP